MRHLKKSYWITMGLFAFLISPILQITQTLWNRIGVNVISTVSFIGEVYAATKEEYKEFFYTLEEALKSILPQAKETKEEIVALTEEQKKEIEKSAGIKFHKDYDKEFHWYKGILDGKVVGYACIDVVPGKWGPVKFMMGLDANGKITDIVVLSLSERRGRPVKERKFLDQYIDKTINDPLKLKKDIRGIASATITSRGVTEGIRKMVYVFKEFYQQK
ncbi:MAG: FMN-binding protein [Nitrospirae bacterium]|nr:FMN-binding protein [Nitrospirota bacterium]